MKSSRRKMLAAREDLADKLSKMAVNKGFTIFGMVNNLLELAVSVEAMGVSLDEAVDNYRIIKAVKNASFTLVLESLLYDTSEIAYQRAKDKTLAIWFDAGVWVGVAGDDTPPNNRCARRDDGTGLGALVGL